GQRSLTPVRSYPHLAQQPVPTFKHFRPRQNAIMAPNPEQAIHNGSGEIAQSERRVRVTRKMNRLIQSGEPCQQIISDLNPTLFGTEANQGNSLETSPRRSSTDPLLNARYANGEIISTCQKLTSQHTDPNTTPLANRANANLFARIILGTRISPHYIR